MDESPISFLVTFFLFIGIGALFSLLEFWEKAQKKLTLYKFISWAYQRYGYSDIRLDLFELIWEKQYHLGIYEDSDAYLSKSDSLLGRIILAEFLIELSQDYFLGNLRMNRAISKWTPEEYFFHTLSAFLMKHQNCESIRDNVLSLKSGFVERGEYGWTQYQLTDFGMIYYKMYYIVESYCQKNENLMPYHRNTFPTHTLATLKTRLYVAL